jgi:hypothetical protein
MFAFLRALNEQHIILIVGPVFAMAAAYCHRSGENGAYISKIKINF